MRPQVDPATIEMIAADYARGKAQRDGEATWWRYHGNPFSAVIERAARAELANGKRHPHQRRLSRTTLEACVQALLPIADQMEAARSFHVLWDFVDKAYGHVPGAGELAVYDTADRLRHRLGLESKHVIYLHAGARVGARRLAGGRLANHDAWGITSDQIPYGLRMFDNHELEDILCIYKDDLLRSPESLRQASADRRFGACSQDEPVGRQWSRGPNASAC
ncbi:hypothetical protein [Phenylobacterium sp.]|uniref:hypothetical protein n=1 Tax=Phenylobacterium sp. TaxID=1871053 RepID=UPI002FC707C5